MPVPPNADDIGAWSDVFSWPVVGLHVSLTPDGRILTFGTDQNGLQSGLHIYDVWDPATGTHSTLSHTTNSDLFCAVAMIVPETGEILIAGGDARPIGNFNSGIADVNIFNYTDQTLTHSPTGPMAFSRWYASAVTTASGQIVMIGGRDDSPPDDIHYSPYVEVYTPGYGFRTLTGAYIDTFNITSLYPRSWLTSSGTIWTSSDGTGLVYSINTSGSGSVEQVGAMPTAISWDKPAVMYAPDRVLLVGNDGSAWIMDLSGAAPTYERTEDVGTGRIWANLTVLPDGRVMISGGSKVYNELVGVSTMVKIWDPDTGQWTEEADAGVARLYHSTAILLPDGTVLTLGGGAPGPLLNLNGEIYSPDYLFDGGDQAVVRPVITEGPDVLDVGEDFTLEVSSAASIDTLALMKFGSVTHSIDVSSQRIELPFTVAADGSLLVDLPDNPNVLTPGYWMLFAIDSNGTPSIAATIKIESEVPYDMPSLLPLEAGVDFETTGAAAYDLYDDSYTLTPDAALKAGSVMSEKRLDFTKPFELSFELSAGDNDAGADGLAFVFHNDPRGADAIGSIGGGLGATGIANGLAIEFDTFQSEDDPTDIANDHTNLLDTDSETALSPVTDLGNIEDGNWHNVKIVWDGASLSYSVDGVLIATLDEDLATNYFGGSDYAYFGFTAGTGGLYEQLKVRWLTLDGSLEDGAILDADRADLPRAPTFVTNGDATYDAALNKFIVTPDTELQHGSVMTEERIDLAKSFAITLSINLGANDAGADGMAFVIHNDPLGNQALGGLGGAMGSLNILNGLAIQLDTFQNEGDPHDIANDHTSLIDTDSEALASPVTDLGNIEDGQWHTLKVYWDGQSLSYTFDGVLMATLAEDIATAYLGGSQFAYLGITAGTGGLSELAQVRIEKLDATAEDGSLLHIIGPNAVPIAGDDSYTVAANGTLTVAAANGVLANDTDPDGDALGICDEPREAHHEVMLAPRNGTVTMNPDGSFSYTPNPGFVGVDTFYYCIEDQWSCCEGKVTITVTGSETQAVAFVTNGDASVGVEPHTFTVVPNAELQHGSVTSEGRISLAAAFSLTFEINLGASDAGADGMAFVLHNDPLGNQALGGLGGAMGALNILNGVAIQFDTFQNEADPNDIANDHTSLIDTDSEVLASAITDLGNIEDGNWHTVSVSWDGETLSYTVDGILAGTLTGDIATDYLGGSQYAYFGFTGATGGLSHEGQVRLLSLEATAEDGTALSLNGSSGSGLTPLVGDDTNNTIAGTNGSDLILGLAGDDSLNGGDGNDTISGGTGNDTLTGDAGSDIFVFAPGFGFDTITDFGDGLAGNIDLLDFSAFGYTTELEILDHAYGAGADSVFDFGNGDVLVVVNTAAGFVTNLTHNDFIV
jgi:hypothetical protein